MLPAVMSTWQSGLQGAAVGCPQQAAGGQWQRLPCGQVNVQPLAVVMVAQLQKGTASRAGRVSREAWRASLLLGRKPCRDPLAAPASSGGGSGGSDSSSKQGCQRGALPHLGGCGGRPLLHPDAQVRGGDDDAAGAGIGLRHRRGGGQGNSALRSCRLRTQLGCSAGRQRAAEACCCCSHLHCHPIPQRDARVPSQGPATGQHCRDRRLGEGHGRQREEGSWPGSAAQHCSRDGAVSACTATRGKAAGWQQLAGRNTPPYAPASHPASQPASHR